MPKISVNLAYVAAAFSASLAYGFESTKVVPKGVRNLTLKNAFTQLDDKTSDAGSPQNLANPLNKSLEFKNIVSGETGQKRKELEGFLLANDFAQTDALGSFTADMRADVHVIAPVLAYGLTDRITLALAVPYYRAASDIEVGFQPGSNANRFINLLAKPENNLVASAREAGEKLNNAVGRLNEKLMDNGYATLSPWSDQGVGDMTLAAKVKTYTSSVFNMATTAGVIAPTGRRDDPDILTDIPFGDGNWDIFAGLSFDQNLTSYLFLNQYAKYTYQLPTTRTVRLKTEEESIEVGKEQAGLKLGNKFELGTSVQTETDVGLTGGIGYIFYQKAPDDYSLSVAASELEWEQNTREQARFLEFKLGYSTIPAFRRKEFPAPLLVSMEYRRHVSSINTLTADLATLDLALFF